MEIIFLDTWFSGVGTLADLTAGVIDDDDAAFSRISVCIVRKGRKY
jgi:hypothetical protein